MVSLGEKVGGGSLYSEKQKIFDLGYKQYGIK